MADPKQLEILKGGSVAWNAWRRENPKASVDLSGADLSGLNLQNILLRPPPGGTSNMAKVTMVSTWLDHSQLREVSLRDANLKGANLENADLTGADLGGANLNGANLIEADLTNANLSHANLDKARLLSSNLSKAGLAFAQLGTAEMAGANLTGADITGCDMSTAIGLRQDEIYSATFNGSSPPQLPQGFAPPSSKDERRAPRVHPRDRIITSGELNTPNTRLRREHSERDLIALRDMLDACVSAESDIAPNDNRLQIAMSSEDLLQMKAIVSAVIELLRAPAYPVSIVTALLGLHTAFTAMLECMDWAPLPAGLMDRVRIAHAAYEGFLTEIGLI